MPDAYLIEDAIRRAFIDSSIREYTLMCNIWFEWDNLYY